MSRPCLPAQSTSHSPTGHTRHVTALSLNVVSVLGEALALHLVSASPVKFVWSSPCRRLCDTPPGFREPRAASQGWPSARALAPGSRPLRQTVLHRSAGTSRTPSAPCLLVTEGVNVAGGPPRPPSPFWRGRPFEEGPRPATRPPAAPRAGTSGASDREPSPGRSSVPSHLLSPAIRMGHALTSLKHPLSRGPHGLPFSPAPCCPSLPRGASGRLTLGVSYSFRLFLSPLPRTGP